MPNRGGGEPIEFDKAAARADTPGPGSEDNGPAPVSGVRVPCKPTAAWLGVGICRTVGVLDNGPEGTGETNRAVDVARGIGLPCERPLPELGEEEIGTGKGRGDEPSSGVDMILKKLGRPLLSRYHVDKKFRNKKVQYREVWLLIYFKVKYLMRQ